MKTSNYIITAFFTFLFGAVFILFVAAKINQKNNKERFWNAEEKKLEPFSVIVAEPNTYFQLRTGEYPRITSTYQLPDSSRILPFGIRNDTLFVFSDSITNNHSNTIYAKNIKGIIAKENAHLNLQDFETASTDTFIVKLNKAKLDMFYQDKKSPNGAIFLQALESEINMGGANIKAMDVKIDKSKIRAWNNSIGSLTGTLKNQSEIHVSVVEKVNIDADPTSAYNILK